MSEEERDEFGRIRKDGNGGQHHQSHNHNNSNRDPRGHEEPPPSGRRDHDNHQNNNGHYYGPAHEEEEVLHSGMVVKGEVVRIESYGAFIDFKDPKLQHRHKGLCHISQMANHRVENVTDVLKINQQVYAVVLEVEDNQRSGKRIRLSLKDVDQSTGRYIGRDLSAAGSRRQAGGGPRQSPHQLQIRAKLRREKYLSLHRDWRDTDRYKMSNDKDVSYLRKLYSASPEPPSHTDTKLSKKLPAKPDSDEESSSSSSASSEEDSSSDSDSSSSSSESDRRSRHRHRSRRGKKEKSSRRRRGRRSKSSRRRRRRRRRDGSSSSETTTTSSCGSSSSSSSSSETDRKSAAKKVKFDDTKHHQTVEPLPESCMRDAQEFKAAVQGKIADDEDDEEGPRPLQAAGGAGAGGGTDASTSYGKALLPGEGEALAQYVQQNLRIPRRGEIGYTGDDIDHFERSGYVMSGSRHKRMNAVRIRKENQVYSAEEQRALALLTMEENQQKEAQLMEDFRTILKEKQKMRQQGGGS